MRILLIHWNEVEARERAARLTEAGHRVEILSTSKGTDYRSLRERVPEAAVIDLSRLPSHGQALGVWLRQQKATRQVPLLFIAGDSAKTERVRRLLPDAIYTSWRGIRGALRRAAAGGPRAPVVPGTMDAYRRSPLPKKLGIAPDALVALIAAPAGIETLLAPMPAGVVLRRALRGRFDLILLFARSGSEMKRRFPAAARALREGGRLWLLWPKKSSQLASDLSQAEVRSFGLAQGFVDFKIAAVDSTWSGLCFVRRK